MDEDIEALELALALDSTKCHSLDVLGIGVGNHIQCQEVDENGSDTDGYHRYYICFHIFVQIRIRIRIVSTMSDKIRLDIDIINMRVEYSDMDTVSDVGYPDSDMDRSQPL